MGRKSKKIIIALALLSGISFFLFARADEEEKYVRLVKAQSVNIITDADGKAFRKAVDATFLHNGTLLVCDTAYWRVDENIINAKGNVRLSQEGTELTSEKLDYYVNDNLAQFRGGIVQLRDKENNILRTHFLDYNTADSVAVFSKGASMKDKDGQIIESLDGTYSSKAKLFTFEKDVNMFTDSVFIKTQALDYHTDSQKAVFRTYIDFWKDDNMLSASSGWYERNDEIFFFTGDVHGTTDKQETWCDSLYFYRLPNNVLMKGSIQLQDSLHNTTAVSRYLFYEDSLSTVTLRREAAVAIVTEDELSQKDTLYFGADTLVYYTLRHCDIPKSELANSTARISEIMTDPVGEYRKKAAEAAAKAQAEALEKAAGTRPGLKPDAASKKQTETVDEPASESAEPEAPDAQPETDAPKAEASAVKDSLNVAVDSLGVPVDSLGVKADSLGVAADSVSVALDSLNVAADSVSVAVDTTKYGFAFARGNVKIFRRDIQVRCDSMHYSDLDSIARFYKDPVIWNEENRQYYSDSLAVLIKKGRVDRASLMSNAFVVTQEDSLLYDQIKSAEIMAFFDSTSALRRFDALGGATAVFFLQENDRIATVNKVESKMLSGNFVKGNIDRIYYYDSPKNDAYPVVQFPQQERYLKGFRWIPERRPTGKQDITTLSIRPSQRKMYAERPRAQFKQTDTYFPGYIKSVYASIDARERARAEAARKKREQQAVEGMGESVADTLAVKDSTMVKLDSTAVTKVDSLAAQVDSTSVDVLQDSLSAEKGKKSFIQKIKDKLEQWKKQREERWARLDERDAAREAAKKEKALKKQREKTRKELIERQKQERREKEILDKYIEYYEKQKRNE